MKSLIEIQNEIESLTAQAKELRAREFDRTLGEIVSQMRAFGISVAQVRDALADDGKAKAKRGRKAKAAPVKAKSSAGTARKPAPVKYRGANGESWSGRGKTPKWLTAALEAGQALDSFRV